MRAITVQPAQHAYRPDIDGLRAVAILCVVVYHAHAAWLPGGFIGVDIFFVISGYLITQILLRDLHDGTLSIVRFYQRRIRRIFPALITVLIACWLMGWFSLLPDEFTELGKHTARTTMFLSNFTFWKEAGYFDRAGDIKPLLHTWSLAVEEQFYLLWPLGLAVLWRVRRHMLLLLMTAALLSLAASIMFSASKPAMSFYLPLTRLWELMAGGMLAYAQMQASAWRGTFQQHRNAKNIMAVLGLGLIGGAAIGIDATMAYPGGLALLPVTGALLLIAAGSQAWINRHLLSARVMVAIGLISYPLYLWHWPLLVFPRITESGHTSAIIISAVALAFLLAWLTTRYIERPLRFGRWQHSRHAMIGMIAAMIAVGGAGLWAQHGQGLAAVRQLDLSKFRDLESLEYFRKTQLYPCPDAYHGKDLSWCYTSHDAAANVALFGDSHADALFPGITSVDTARTWLLIGHSSCPPLLDIRSFQKQRPEECLTKNRTAMDAILATPSIHTVVLTTLGGYYLGHTISPQHQGAMAPDHWLLESTHANEQGLPRSEIFYRGMKRTVQSLIAAKKNVVIFLDVPEFDFMPLVCIERPLTLMAAPARTPCGVARATNTALHAEFRALVALLVREYPAVRVYDPYPSLCDAMWCYAGDVDMLYYRDSHHLSVRGSNRVARDFIAWLQQAPTVDTAR